MSIQVMKSIQRVLGEKHPNILISMSNLASTYRNQGRLKEAEELGVQVMNIRKRVLGEEHADTLCTAIRTFTKQEWGRVGSRKVLTCRVV